MKDLAAQSRLTLTSFQNGILIESRGGKRELGRNSTFQADSRRVSLSDLAFTT